MCKTYYEFIYNLIFSNRTRNISNLPILWHFSDKMICIEIVDSIISNSSSQCRNMMNIWILCHGGHSSINVFFVKLRFYMLVENIAKLLLCFIHDDDNNILSSF